MAIKRTTWRALRIVSSLSSGTCLSSSTRRCSCRSTSKIERLGREFHNPERMLKARVHGTWVDQVGHGQLSDVPQALENWVIHHLTFVDRIANETMHGTPDPLSRLVAL